MVSTFFFCFKENKTGFRMFKRYNIAFITNPFFYHFYMHIESIHLQKKVKKLFFFKLASSKDRTQVKNNSHFDISISFLSCTVLLCDQPFILHLSSFPHVYIIIAQDINFKFICCLTPHTSSPPSSTSVQLPDPGPETVEFRFSHGFRCPRNSARCLCQTKK